MKPTERYWRGLEGSKAARARALPGEEFPEGSSDSPQVDRRTLLKLVGGTLSLAGLSACRRPVEKIVPFVQPPEEILPGVPQHYATAMPWGASAFGLVVESHEGRPTKIEGNELHPATRGASSTWMQASLLELYDPDRSRSVRGPGDATTWEAAEAAWKTLAEGFAASGGQGLAVLAEPFSSPALERAAAQFRERFPQASWTVYEPWGDENVMRGLEAATGTASRLLHHFERARVLLCVDADPLLLHPESVRHGRGFAEGRRVTGAEAAMNRLYVVESAMTVTGVNADHRKRLRPSAIPAFVAQLAGELANQGVPIAAEPTRSSSQVDEAWVHALARDLAANAGRGLVMAGEGQSPEVHAAVHAINIALGNVGQTVTLVPAGSLDRPDLRAFANLTRAMAAGEVAALVILGGNPVYDAPADLDFAAALAKVPASFHLSPFRDETSNACTWHLPRAHWLESWGDVRALDGTLSVVQPLIAPLYGGRTPLELVALLAGIEGANGYDLVREAWRGVLGDLGFDASWNRLLHDGLFEGGSAPPTVEAGSTADVAGLFASLARTQAGGDGLELVFRPSSAVYDGRFANNAWLQELPDPVTKITWDNAALLSPATAAALGVAEGDYVRIAYAGRELELPAWVVPGQADDTVVLPLGYGRTAAGRIGNGVGFDTYRLRGLDALAIATGGVELRRGGGSYVFSETQHHNEMDSLGEREQAARIPMIVREADVAEHREHPEWVAERGPEAPYLESLWTEPAYTDPNQWGMTIDLNACTGCNACVVACQAENNIPVVGRDEVGRGREMHWIRIDRYFKGEPEDAGAVFQPVTCMHCENAPCEQVCPVAATVHDNQGLNTMVYNRCIGTRYCANNCPYKVRRFNFYNFTKDTPEVQQLAANPDVTVRSRGVMEKCTYCVQRINEGRIAAKLAGREMADGDVTTACEQACPTHAIVFGNVRDPESRVSRSKADPRNYVLLEELNNQPRTSYLGKLRNPNPEIEA